MTNNWLSTFLCSKFRVFFCFVFYVLYNRMKCRMPPPPQSLLPHASNLNSSLHKQKTVWNFRTSSSSHYGARIGVADNKIRLKIITTKEFFFFFNLIVRSTSICGSERVRLTISTGCIIFHRGNLDLVSFVVDQITI